MIGFIRDLTVSNDTWEFTFSDGTGEISMIYQVRNDLGKTYEDELASIRPVQEEDKENLSRLQLPCQIIGVPQILGGTLSIISTWNDCFACHPMNVVMAYLKWKKGGKQEECMGEKSDVFAVAPEDDKGGKESFEEDIVIEDADLADLVGPNKLNRVIWKVLCEEGQAGGVGGTLIEAIVKRVSQRWSEKEVRSAIDDLAEGGVVIYTTGDKQRASRPKFLWMKCEAGALNCLNDIREQIETKRVLIFGLRSLVEYLCTRGRGQLVDNVLGCIDADMTNVLCDLYDRYGTTDDDIRLSLLKIVGSMIRVFTSQEESQYTKLIQKALDQGFDRLFNSLINNVAANAPLSDTQFWPSLYDPILVCINQSGAQHAATIATIEPATIDSLTSRLKNDKKVQKAALLCVSVLSHIYSNAAEANAKLPIFELLTAFQRTMLLNKYEPNEIAEVLSAVLAMLNKSNSVTPPPDAIDSTIKIMEYTRGKPSLQESLGRILALLVSQEQLDHYIDDLMSNYSLKSLQVVSALSRANTSSETKQKMLPPALKIMSTFQNPTEHIEALRAAVAITQSFLESSSAPSQTPQIVQDFIRILQIPGFPLEDPVAEAMINTLNQLYQASPKSFDLESQDELYHTFASIIQESKDLNTVTQAQKFAALLVNANPQKAIAANLPAISLRRFQQALKSKAPTDGSRHPAVEMVGSLCKFEEAMMKNEETTAMAIEAAAPISECLSLMKHADRYIFESMIPYLQKVAGRTGDGVDMSAGILKCSITFADMPSIVKACESILRTTASEADIDKLVQSLVKASKEPKANLQACEDVCATIHGVSALSQGEGLNENVLEGLIKSINHVCSAAHFEGQVQLISHILACVKALAPIISNTHPLKDEPHKILSIAHSSGARAIADQESTKGAASDSIITEMIKCAAGLIALDHFDASMDKCISDVSTLMRKYPEQRKTQIACMELLLCLVSSSTFDISPEFIKSGLCKQLMSTMTRGSAIVEYQLVGLKIILAVAHRRSENLDGLRRSGVIDVLKKIAENYQAKPDVFRLCQQAQAILMPQEQSRDEVLSQIESLQVAGKNRDVNTGSEALNSLAGLTAAADAAKFAAKNGVGNAMNTFFENMRTVPQAAGEVLDTCSLGAVQTLRNVGNVGKPHSTLMLKSGALPLVQTILLEASRAEGPIAEQVVAQCLEAGRCLLANESSLNNVTGIAEYKACLNKMLPELLKKNDPKQVMGIVSTVGMLAPEDALAEGSPVVNSLPALVAVLNNATNEDERTDVLRCMFQMMGRQVKLVERFTECGGCEAVIRCLDRYGCDEQKTAIWCRKVLEKIISTNGDIQRAILKRGGASGLNSAVKALGRSLGHTRGEVNDTATVGMLCKLTARTGIRAADLDTTGILENLTELELNDSMKYMMGALLTNLGGDDVVDEHFRKLIECCERNGSKPDLIEILKKLDNLIYCEPEDVSKSFGRAPKAMRCLTEGMTKFQFDVDLLDEVGLFMLSMCERFKTEHSEFGVEGCIQCGYVNCLVDLVCKNDPKSSTRKATQFLKSSYETLILCCSNPLTYPNIVKLCQETQFLGATWDLLYRYQHNEELATAIIGFLGHFSRTEGATEMVEKCLPRPEGKSTRDLKSGADSVSEIWKIVWNLRRNPNTVQAGLDSLGMILSSKPNQREIINSLDIKEKSKEMASSSVEGACGYAGFARCMLEIPNTDVMEEQDYADILEILVRQYLRIKDDDTVEREIRDRLLRRMAGIIISLAQKGKFQPIKNSKALDCLLEATKSEVPVDQAVLALLQAIWACREDRTIWNFMTSSAIPLIATVGQSQVLEDQTSCQMLVDTCLLMCLEDEDSKRALQEVGELLSLVSAIEQLAQSSPEAEQLRINATKLRELLEHKQFEKLTLEIVYKRWSCRIQRAGGIEAALEVISLGANASSEMLSELEFVINQTQDISTQSLKSVASNPVAREFWFGAHCFELLHYLPLNAKILTTGVRNTQIQTWMLAALEYQPAEETLQAIVQGITGGVERASEDYSIVPKAAEIMVDIVRRGTDQSLCQDGINSWTTARVVESDENVPLSPETWLVERLYLMAAACNDRKFYNATDALDVLKYIIGLVDSNKGYTISTIQAVLKVLRAMANEDICDKFIELKFPEYLLGLVDNASSPKDLLADALMVIGYMASFIKTKNYFGRLEGIQRIVALLKRAEKEKVQKGALVLAISRVQQNSCLALGNLVLGHPLNGTKFGKEGGVDLAVKIMNNAMGSKVDYDLANAVCVLISNASFKRDDFKEAFGNAQACTSILQCFKKYDGADCPSAYRCLNSMFKAVGNLGLLPANVQRFLDADIGKSLKSFYKQDSSAKQAPVPDELLLVSLKTLSNLTLENSEAFMVHFGAILLPLIDLVSSGRHNLPELMATVCDTFASLCRNPENRSIFLSHHGVEKSIELVNQFKDEKVYVKGLELFGVLASYSEAAKRMAESNIFNFILSVLEECEDLEALTVVSALRVIRRLVTDRSVAKKFIESSPMSLLCECLKAATPYADQSVPCALTVQEICHIILILLCTSTDSNNTGVDFNQIVVPRDVPWAEDILSGVASLTSKQFSRVFSRRLKTSPSNEEESEESDEGDSRSGSSDDVDSSNASTSVDYQSLSANDQDDDDIGSPVDLQTPPRKKESVLEIRSNVVGHGDVLNKPQGRRAYQEAGIDARMLVLMCRALFLMFARGANDSFEDHTLRLDKLSEYGLSLIAYAVSEKVDGCGLIFVDSGTGAAASHTPGVSDVSLIVEKIFSKTKEQKSIKKLKLVAIGADLMTNACCVMDTADLQSIPANQSAYQSMKSCSNSLNKSSETILRRKVEELWTMFEAAARSTDGLKPSSFYQLATYDFPLDIRDLSKEEFVNGVQDLPFKLRNKIRKGGKNKCIIKDNNGAYVVKPLWWKSSTDMLSMKYMTDKENHNYDNEIVIGRARRILRGPSDADIKKQLKNLKVKSRHIVTICGGESPGVNMVFSNRIKASRMYERFATWHAAATR